jgi:hypothetical protein
MTLYTQNIKKAVREYKNIEKDFYSNESSNDDLESMF